MSRRRQVGAALVVLALAGAACTRAADETEVGAAAPATGGTATTGDLCYEQQAQADRISASLR